MRSSKVYKQKRTDRKRLRSLHFEVKEEGPAKRRDQQRGLKRLAGKAGNWKSREPWKPRHEMTTMLMGQVGRLRTD